MNNKYIITFDYEIFGSGKGCFYRDLIKPTNKIISILNKYNIKATFFVEYLEVVKFKQLAQQGISHPNAIRVHEVEAQIQQLAVEGHDIQLHIHPQWEGATFNGSEFELNFHLWRFSSLPLDDSVDQRGMKSLLEEGKQYLEALIRPVVPDYHCIGFRAGGYNIGETPKSVIALRDTGFLYDSSVYTGGYSKKGLSRYDYRSIDGSSCFWETGHTILDKNDSNQDNRILYEFPIFAVNKHKLNKLSIARIASYLKGRKKKSIFYRDNSIDSSSANKDDNKSSLNASFNWDVCLLSRRMTDDFIDKTIKDSADSKKAVKVFTLIGHPKDYSVFSPLTYLLRKTSRCSYSTLTDFLRLPDLNRK